MSNPRGRTRPGSATNWHRGLNLVERLEAGRRRRPDAPEIAHDAALAADRLARWRSEPAFREPADFEARLAMDGLDSNAFARILGEPVDARGASPEATPWWATVVERAYARAPSRFAEPELPASVAGMAHARLLVVLAPLIDQARSRLRDGLAELLARQPSAPIDAAAFEAQWYASLPRQLLALVSRTLVLELHVARLRGRLAGTSPQQRFHSFVVRLGRRAVAAGLLREYPVLARQVVVCLAHWQDAGLRFARDLLDDWNALRAKWPPLGDAGSLSAIEGNAGDPHRGGRSVLVLGFSSGFKLVYKPRSLAVDAQFQRLLEWVDTHGGYPMRPLELLDRGDHGWVGFVAREVQLTEAQAERYFWRHGAYLALLLALEATDFHYENLIVAGEHPALVDLEALFQPRLQDAARSGAADIAARELNYSVLRVGLLPQWLFAGRDRVGLDVSGLGAAADQTTPFELPQWRSAGTDDMHLVRERGVFSGSPNRPTVDGKLVSAVAYADAIVAGFTHVYRLITNQRARLLAPDGLLAGFAGTEVRVLLRATRTYSRLLQESCHPDVLRDALDRDRLFDNLWSSVSHIPSFPRVIAAERRALWNLDIPSFSTWPGSRDLRCGDGEIIPDFLDEPGMASVRRQIECMSEADLTRQTWLIRAALATIAMDAESAVPAPAGRPPWWPAPGAADPLTMADAVGRRLGELAIRGADDASWIGLALVGSRAFDLAPLALDLYDGLPGVALFLAHLGEQTGERRHAELARAAMITVISESRRMRAHEKCVGGFAGWGGIIHACTQLGVLWHRGDLVDEAEAAVAVLPGLIPADESLDVIAGVAGCIPPLLNLYRRTGSAAALETARLCGQRLADTAIPQAVGCGWHGAVPSARPLAGFSHGASGIAWALLELAGACGEKRLADLARSAIAYERTLFAPDAANWEDARAMGRHSAEGDPPSRRFQVAWCHGAPGIGLARLLCLRHIDDAETRAEIETALTTTMGRGFGASHCMCHGDMGNLDVLLHAARALPGERWARESDRCAGLVLERLARTGPICANPAAIESPGLMTGLAGIGYGLLRLAAPQSVPSVLSLSPI